MKSLKEIILGSKNYLDNKIGADTTKIKTDEKSLDTIINESRGIVTDKSYEFGDNKGEVTIKHPDNNEKLYKKMSENVGVISNAVNNTANFAIQAGYQLEGDNSDIEAVRNWIDNVNFDLYILNIFKQLQIYGNVYLELNDMQELKFLPVEDMFVVVYQGNGRDGEIAGYKQMLNNSKYIEFDTDEIIHFKWNEIGTSFYGYSDLKPVIGTTRRLLQFQIDLGNIIHGYSNPIMHHILGNDESTASKEQVSSYKNMLNNRKVGEDIVTSSAVEIKPIVANLKMLQPDGMIKHLENQIIAALCVPEIFIRGGETSNKATADVELKAFDRKVRALQEVVGKYIEEQIFSKITNGKVKIVWNEMSVEGEATKAETILKLTQSGVPTKVALDMVGWGSWKNEYEEEMKKVKDEMEKKPEQKPDISKKQNEPEEMFLDQYEEEYLKKIK